ncbi:MAG: cytochrome [Sphingomonas bacterium]|nr:cytochrome [Sphingomonas bacterium]
MTMQFAGAAAIRPGPPPSPAAALPEVTARRLAHVPGKKGMPFFGILPEAVMDPYRFARRMYERFGPVHRFYACGNWNLQLVGPEANEFVLFDAPRNFSAAGGWEPVFGRHFKGGLLLRDGDDHQRHRKLVAAAFKQHQMEGYLGIFNRVIPATLPAWRQGRFDAYAKAQALTFGIGFATFLGEDEALATQADLNAFRSLMRSSTSVVTTPLPGNSEWRATRAQAHVRRLIDRLLARGPGPERRDLLANLVRDRAETGLSIDEIVSHLVFVTAASFDTLSSATVSVLYYLAKNPEWQEAVRAELTERIPDPHAATTGQLTGCALAERILKEALRLNAAAPVLWRRAVRDCTFEGVEIPRGTIVGVNPMLTHLLPQYWPNPDAFDPDRFLPARSEGRHRYAFAPFGGGAHTCLGMHFASLQVKLLLRHLLEDGRITLTSSRPPKWHHWPNCRPVGGLGVEIVAR